MKTLNALPKIMAILFFIIAVASCDEDFNTIGVDVIGDDDLLTSLQVSENIVAYSRILDPLQTNIVPVHSMGVYNDHVFGKSSVNLLTQVVLSEPNPTFGDSIGRTLSAESVILYIPFYSNAEEEGSGNDAVITYTLDSVYGNSPINITLYESNYFLRDTDPESNFQDPQLYYSNQGPIFEDNLIINSIPSLTFEIEDFVPSDEGYIVTNTTIGEDDEEIIDTTYVAPGLRVELPLQFFQEKILDQEGEQVLTSNNNFKEYLRGLYFKIESNTDDGSLFIFNPEFANITINYNYEEPTFDDNNHYELDEDGNIIYKTVEDNSYSLNFGGVSLNTHTNELPQNIIGAIEDPDLVNGEENLYIRGGEGIITVINLFSDTDEDGVSAELDDLRNREILVNDANLKFYVDQDKITGGSTEPERIIIFDLDNNTVLTDYFLDTTSGNQPVDAVTTHLGRLERGSDNLGEYYKIRLTNHISNLINKDSTNVQLGLLVSQNVLISGFHVVDSLTNPEGPLPRIKEVLRSSVISHEGTVLFGNNTANEEKRLKLEISYIEPN